MGGKKYIYDRVRDASCKKSMCSEEVCRIVRVNRKTIVVTYQVE